MKNEYFSLNNKRIKNIRLFSILQLLFILTNKNSNYNRLYLTKTLKNCCIYKIYNFSYRAINVVVFQCLITSIFNINGQCLLKIKVFDPNQLQKTKSQIAQRQQLIAIRELPFKFLNQLKMNVNNFLIKQINKMRKIGVVGKFFAEFDLFETPAFLRIREDEKMKSCPIGFASFAISCFFIYVFLNGCMSIIKYESIDATMQESIIPQENAQGNVSTFAVGFDNLTIDEINTMFVPIVFSRVGFTQASVRNLLIPCIAQKWSNLGEDYVSKFYEYQLDRFYCMDVPSQYFLNQTATSSTSIWFVGIVYLCTFNPMSKICNETKAMEYIKKNKLKINVYLLDIGFSPQQKISIRPFINTDVKFLVSSEVTQMIQVFWSAFRIETDSSLVSFSSNQIEQGIFVGNIKNYYLKLNNPTSKLVARIDMYMNNGLRIYRRTIGKLDDFLSYVGGLFQILIGFIAFFLSSFNQYRYELKVSEGAFNFHQDGRKIKETDFNFLSYVKYGIYDWIKTLFFFQLKWKFCNQIDEIREEIVSQMEVNRFYKRVNNAQTAIDYTIGDNQNDFIKLVEPPTVQRVKQRRLKLNYGYIILSKEWEMFEKKQLVKKETKLRFLQENQQQKNQTQVLQKKKEILQSIILSSEIESIQVDLANSLYAVRPQFRNEIDKNIASSIRYRLKIRKQNNKLRQE